MKKSIAATLMVLLLAGCAAAPSPSLQPSAVEIPTQAVTASPSPSPTTSSPTPMRIDTPDPALTDPQDTAEPSLLPTVEEEYSEAYVCHTEEQWNNSFSEVAVSDGKVVYYRMDKQFDSKTEDYRYDYYTTIMMYNQKTGKSKEYLSTKGKGFVFDLVIDQDGILYYTLGENICPDNPLKLYKHVDGKSTLLVDDIERIICLDNNILYYAREINLEEGYDDEELTYNLKSHKKALLPTPSTEHPCPPYVKQQVLYRVDPNGTEVKLIDCDHKTEKVYHIKDRIQQIDSSFIFHDILTLVADEQDNATSTVYRIRLSDGAVLPTQTIDSIQRVIFYKEKCFLYTYRDIEETIIDEKLQAFDPESGKVKFLMNLNVTGGDHLKGASIKATCGKLWIYCRYGGDGFYADFVDSIKIPAAWLK